MTADAILIDLWRDSINVRLTPEQRTRVLENKPDLIQYLRDAHGTTERLLAAALRVCDHHGDDEAARLRTTMASWFLSRRRWTASSTSSCSQREMRRYGLAVHCVHISAHRGRRFRLIVDGISA